MSDKDKTSIENQMLKDFGMDSFLDPEISKQILLKEQKKKEASDVLIKQIQDYFAFKKWHYIKLNEDGSIMLLAFKQKNSVVRLRIKADASTQCIIFHSALFCCQKEYRLAMSDYLNKLNSGNLRYGAFHMDKKDGEIFYRYSFSFREQPFSQEAFHEYVIFCINTVDNHVKAIEKIANGHFSKMEREELLLKMKSLATALSQ